MTAPLSWPPDRTRLSQGFAPKKVYLGVKILLVTPDPHSVALSDRRVKSSENIRDRNVVTTCDRHSYVVY